MAGTGGWRPSACRGDCDLSFDFDTRESDQQFGVACPYEPACWEGVEWYPLEVLEAFACNHAKIFEELGRINGLHPLTAKLDGGAVPIGVHRGRGKHISVVWVDRVGSQFETLCMGYRQRLGGDGLIVLVPHVQQIESCLPAYQVAVVDFIDDESGEQQLWRGLNMLDPYYARRRVADQDGVFEEVWLEFASIPGERHVLRLNGREVSGVSLSDPKFLRMALLALARVGEAEQGREGWIDRARLDDDDKGHRVDDLRAALRACDCPELSHEERGQLIKTASGRASRVRLAVSPEHIIIDTSLRQLALLEVGLPSPVRSRSGKGQATKTSVEAAPGSVRVIIEELRRLGLSVGG